VAALPVSVGLDALPHRAATHYLLLSRVRCNDLVSCRQLFKLIDRDPALPNNTL
jgi:hypothetical protein